MSTGMLLPCMLLFLVVVVLPPALASPSAVSLTKEDFDEITKDKTVFIKFYAPWCGHCQKLAPEWEKMRLEWVQHAQGLVAEVDCTQSAELEKWCSKDLKIMGFPTLLYGDPTYGGIFLKEYNDEKTYEALSTFANNTLSKPFCSPGRLDACEGKTRRELETYWKMSEKRLENVIAKKEKQIHNAKVTFQKQFDRMQATYDRLSRKHELEAATIKANLKILKAVKSFLDPS